MVTIIDDLVDPDDADVTAKAIVGNRTMLVEPTRIKARVSNRDEV